MDERQSGPALSPLDFGTIVTEWTQRLLPKVGVAWVSDDCFEWRYADLTVTLSAAREPWQFTFRRNGEPVETCLDEPVERHDRESAVHYAMTLLEYFQTE